MKLIRILAASSALALAAGGAHAITLQVAPGGTNTAANNFYSQFEAIFGVGNVGFAILVGATTGANETVDFKGVAKEAAYINTFTAGGAPGGSMVNSTFDMDISDVEAMFSTTFAGGALSAADLMFTSNLGTPAMIGDIGFGVFFDITGTIRRAFLAYDDAGAGPDDNHDDMVVEVLAGVQVVPLPASALLLLGGLGGLAVLRRKKA